MRFHHYMATHIASQITGPRHNYLAIAFAEDGVPDGVSLVPLVVELPPQGGCEHRPLDANRVVSEVLAGVAEGNEEFGVRYVVESIHFFRNDTGPEEVYRSMAKALVGETKLRKAEEQAAFRNLVARASDRGDTRRK